MMVQRRIVLLVLLFAAAGSSHVGGATQQANHKQQHKQQRNRRRHLQSTSTGDGKFDPEKDHPCLGADGSILLPDILDGIGGGIGGGGGGDLGIGDGYGGGRRLRPVRRILQQAGGGGGTDGEKEDRPNPWDLCEGGEDSEEEAGDDDDDSSANGGNGTDVPGDPVDTAAPTSVAPLDATQPNTPDLPSPNPPTSPPTPQPSPEPTHPPPLSPEPVTIPPTPIPKDFWDPFIRNTILCQVSVALPAFYPRDRNLRGLDEGERVLHIDSEDDDKQEMGHDDSRRFKKTVAFVMIDVILNATDYHIIEGPKGMRHLREEEGFTFPISNLLGDKVLLVLSRTVSSVSEIDNKEFGDHHSVRWWLYTIPFHSLYQDDMFETIQKNVMVATEASIESGDFFERLSERFSRLVAVSRVGEEANAIVREPTEGDALPPGEFDVRFWDASRYVGLGLFALTLLSTLALTRTAQDRRKKVQEQEHWGVGLATENGINKLLTYGWEYDGATNQVHAFDKSKLVYRDDDSMLIGGAYPLQYAGSRKVAPTEAVTSSQNTQESPTERSPSSRDDPSSRGPSSGMGDSGQSGIFSGMGDSGQVLGQSSRLAEF